jgi:hypothetical protein
VYATSLGLSSDKDRRFWTKNAHFAAGERLDDKHVYSAAVISARLAKPQPP